MPRLLRSSSVYCLVMAFLISLCLIPSRKPLNAADESALKGVFTNTMYGLFTGCVLAGTITLADGDAHGDDWARNLGIGGAIGAFVGATYGFAKETSYFVTYDERGVKFGIPIPDLKNTKTRNNTYRWNFKLFQWRY